MNRIKDYVKESCNWISEHQDHLPELSFELLGVTNADLACWADLAKWLKFDNFIEPWEYESITWRLKSWETLPIIDRYALFEFFTEELKWYFM